MTGFHGNKLVSHVIHTKKSLEVLRIEDREGFGEFPTICRRASRLSYLTGSVAPSASDCFMAFSALLSLATGAYILIDRDPREEVGLKYDLPPGTTLTVLA
jgi:hypothetical protein